MLNIRRMHINQPSTSQTHHRLHGTHVLADVHGDGIATVYPVEGSVISMRILSNALSPGWPEYPGKNAQQVEDGSVVLHHEEDMVRAYLDALVTGLKLINKDSDGLSAEEEHLVYRYACQITAYMNGRIHQATSPIPSHQSG